MKDKNIELYFINAGDSEDISLYVDSLYSKFPSSCVDFPDRGDSLEGRVIVRRNGSFPEDVVRHIFSKERSYLPTHISCENKNDYCLVEKILKEECGDSFGFDNGFWSKILNNKQIISNSPNL